MARVREAERVCDPLMSRASFDEAEDPGTHAHWAEHVHARHVHASARPHLEHGLLKPNGSQAGHQARARSDGLLLLHRRRCSRLFRSSRQGRARRVGLERRRPQSAARARSGGADQTWLVSTIRLGLSDWGLRSWFQWGDGQTPGLAHWQVLKLCCSAAG